MVARAETTGPPAVVFRIGEVAKLTGLTTRTLRYWEEMGLLSPSGHSSGGDRHYTEADMSRATRIRDLQKLLGFSLAEVRMVLDTEGIDVLDRVKSEFRSSDPSPARQRQLVEEAIVANDRLLARLDQTLAHIEAFRTERVASAARLRARRRALDAELGGRRPRPGTAAVSASRATNTEKKEKTSTERGRVS